MTKTHSVSKKLGISLIVISVAAVAILAGTLAMFSASTESSVVAAAGTVQIELSEVKLTNFKNINPGDNDPAISKQASKGTSHEVKYSVTNLGTKSIQTRQTILLTATPSNGSKKSLLDARYLKLFDGRKELEDKSYILSNGKEVTKLKEDQKVIAVKYVFYGDSFNGSENANVVKMQDPDSQEEYYIIEKEDGNSAFVTADDNGDVYQDYSFDFCLLDETPNEYQNAQFDIYVAVEALQYRNSTEEDWDEAATVVRGFSTNRKISINSMPSFTEDAEGEEIEVNVQESEAFDNLI